ncbi:MAG: HAD family hydrolase [Verrucomicrobia bacterium]|nr:HAD family hydrolase [Verrucomicrobiota bacterium]
MSDGRPAVFLDRDGTIIEDANYLADPVGVRLIPGALDALRQLAGAGFALIVVTNQSGIGRGYFAESDYHRVAARMTELLDPGLILATYFCPDHPGQPSTRRKPAPGMLLEAAAEHGLELARSFMIGDRRGDIEAGRAAGCAASILVRTGIGESEAAGAGADFVAADLTEAAAWCLARRGRGR